MVRNKNMNVFIFMFHRNTQTVVFSLTMSINDFTFSLFIIIVRRSARRSKWLPRDKRVHTTQQGYEKTEKKNDVGQSAFNVLMRVYIT